MKWTQLFCLMGPTRRSFLDADEFDPNLKKVISILEKFSNDLVTFHKPKENKRYGFPTKV